MDKIAQKLQFANQLKAAMVAKGFPPKAAVLEREFNLRFFGKPITLHAAGKWLRGEAIPRNDKVVTLAKWLEVEPADLVYGLEIKEEIQKKKARWVNEVGYQERELFELFLDLPAPQRKVVRDVIVAFHLAYNQSV